MSHRFRSFIAIELDDAVQGAARDLIRQLSATGADVRWSRSDLHATLKFLGDVEPDRLEQVHATIQSVAARQAPFPLEVRGLGAFPSWRKPMVLWIGLHAPPLAELAAAIEAALADLGFAREPRPFRGHVTVGRVRSLRDWKKMAPALDAHLDDLFGRCTIDSVTIFRSTLQPTGSVYTPLWRVPLGIS